MVSTANRVGNNGAPSAGEAPEDSSSALGLANRAHRDVDTGPADKDGWHQDNYGWDTADKADPQHALSNAGGAGHVTVAGAALPPGPAQAQVIAAQVQPKAMFPCSGSISEAYRPGGVVKSVPGIGGFASDNLAAKAVLSKVNPVSIHANRETGGFIYGTLDGKYGYTAPIWGNEEGVDLRHAIRLLPQYVAVTGEYHTHADYSTNVQGKILRTGEPHRDDYGSDFYSSDDVLKAVIHALTIARSHDFWGSAQPSEYTAYLGTPRGEFWFYKNSIGLLR